MLTALAFVLVMPALRLAAAVPETSPPEPVLSVDLDGDGVPESVTATVRGRKVRVEIRSSSRALLASADAPAPAAGSPSVAFTSGSLGSTGSLLEIVTAAGAQECRSVWRFREGALVRLPLPVTAGSSAPGASSGAASRTDCGPRDEWTYSWDQPSPDAPAEYRREKTRETANGPHRLIESFRYAGFQLEADPSRSRSEIRGILIPSWYAARLYRKSALESLYARFDLTPLKKGPRLRFRTDPAAGVFDLTVDRSYGEWTLPVTDAKKTPGRNELTVTLGPDAPSRKARMTFPGNGSVPGDVILTGFGEDVDGLYGPATRMSNGEMRVFESADDELASNGLVGGWTGPHGDTLTIALASSTPLLLGIGKERFRIDLEGAPDGLDAVLVPGEGAGGLGVVLRGPDTFERVPIRCEKGKDAKTACHSTGSGELLHRIGARMNVR